MTSWQEFLQRWQATGRFSHHGTDLPIVFDINTQHSVSLFSLNITTLRILTLCFLFPIR